MGEAKKATKMIRWLEKKIVSERRQPRKGMISRINSWQTDLPKIIGFEKSRFFSKLGGTC